MGKYPVTILIPTYCTSLESIVWFEQCFGSALAQDCDVVVWDDNSPSPYGEHIRKIVNDAGLMYTLISNNHGPAHARNRAAELADTELIFPLDCDDVLSPGAIADLYAQWDGKTPVYPDLYKFGTQNVSHFRLRDWSCELQYSTLGIAPVNVLHSKAQWQAIGGWDENFTKDDLYEDAEYNARLFLTYCGRAYHKPLVGYRQHDSQRTSDKIKAASLVKPMLQRIGGYNLMGKGCCGKGRKSPSNAPPAYQQPNAITSLQQAKATQLPGQQGDRVLALYTGGRGKMTHYYRGVVTNFPYKVQYGDMLYVDARDAREEDDKSSKSQLVRVRKEEPQVVAQPVSVARSPRQQPPSRDPVVEELPVDISKMKVSDIENEDWPPEIAAQLLVVEKRGANRTRAVNHLEKLANVK